MEIDIHNDGMKVNLGKLAKSLKKSDIDTTILEKYEAKEPRMYVSTGDTLLDMHMGRGIPIGKFVEIYGEESTAKSTLAQQIVNNTVNDHNGLALVMDIENGAWEYPERNIALGLNPEKLNRIMYTSPGTVEQVFNVVHSYIEEVVLNQNIRNVPIVIVWDSIAASTSSDEFKNEYGKIGYLQQARIIAQGHRKLVSLINDNHIDNVSFIWLNQARKSQAQGPYMAVKYVTFGGAAPAFFSSIRIELKHRKTLSMERNGKKQRIGIVVSAKTVKNKLFPPHQECETYVFATGTDSISSIYNWLKESTLVKKAGKRDDTTETYKLSTDPPLFFSNMKTFRALFQENEAVIMKFLKETHMNVLQDCVSTAKGEELTEEETPEPEEN